MRQPAILLVSLLLQVVSLTYFLWDMATSVLGIAVNPLHYQTREVLHILATLGLLSGFVMTLAALRRLWRDRAVANERQRLAASEFRDLLDERFAGWSLSPAERDVAMFVIKGFSTSEIAELRQTSEGTVKAQCASIFRKTGLSGRTQLLSSLIEDMVGAPPPLMTTAPDTAPSGLPVASATRPEG